MNIQPCSVIREAEQAVFASGATTSAALMSTVVERLWQATRHEPVLCGMKPQRVVVYAGRGNNAGDALGLAARFQCPVTLRAVCEPQAFSPESLEQFAQLAGHELSVAKPAPQEGLLIIDGLLGSGATGALREPYAALVEELNELRAQSPRSCTLAIDVPTGLNADTGEVLGTLTNVDTRGHADLYTVKTANGEALLPAVPEFVIKIDLEDAIYVRPIPGLLDGGSEQV